MGTSIWNQNLGVLVTAGVSFAAVIVSVAQVWVAFITKAREIELEQLRHRREERAKAEERERDWNFRAVEFVAQHQDLLFGEDAARRDRIARVMLVSFPPAVTQALFKRLETTTAGEGASDWRKQTTAATRLLLVRTDGLYVTEAERGYRVLRFLEDGTVLSTSIGTSGPLDYELVGEWLIPGANHPEGSVPLQPTGDAAAFSLEGARLRFSTTWQDVVVDYEGLVRGNRLYLHSHSHKTDYRATETYEFVALDE